MGTNRGLTLHQRPIITNEDFIQTWHIPEGICDGILEYFENNEKPVVGKLHIGNSRFDVTYQELDQIARTMHAAKEVVNRKFKMGMMR